jgi:hypothetical protein
VSESLPQPLAEYALLRIIGERSPAYLLVSKSGELLEWGGDLTAYGIEDLERGAAVESRVACLVGALPIASVAVVLPSVTMRAGIAADVHVVPGEEGDWVLFLDASAGVRYQEIAQQAWNELALLREAYEKLRMRVDAKEREPRSS